VAQSAVKSTATIVMVVPDHRVEVAHAISRDSAPIGLRFVGFFIAAQNVIKAFYFLIAKLVLFFSPLHLFGHAIEPGESAVQHLHPAGLDRRVDMKHPPDQFSVPRPVVFGVRCTVHAEVTLEASIIASLTVTGSAAAFSRRFNTGSLSSIFSKPTITAMNSSPPIRASVSPSRKASFMRCDNATVARPPHGGRGCH
jgi:hypothetical protein